MRSALLPLITFLIVLVVPAAWADTTITQVTANSYDDRLPHVQGNFLVWQTYDGSDWEVFLYNITDGTTTQITDNAEDDVSPQTDGHYVVWQGFNSGEWDVFIWDGVQVQRISDQGAEDTAPQIANGWVVWASQPSNDSLIEPGEIFLYDAHSQTSMILSALVDPGNIMDDRLPVINDGAVMWIQTGDDGSVTGYMYKLSDGTIMVNPEDVKRNSQSSDGNLRVLSRHDRQDAEIFLYSSYSRRYYQITDNSFQDRYPSISGNLVAWTADGEVFLAACEYLTLLKPGDGVTLSPRSSPTFSWEGIGYEKYKIAFSKYPGFSTGSILTIPAGGQDWLAGTSLELTEEAWKSIVDMVEGDGTVYWRVMAEDADGEGGFSEMRDFVIAESGMTAEATVQGGGSDPIAEGNGGTCFITTAADGEPGKVTGWTVTLSLVFVAMVLVMFARRRLYRRGYTGE
jgi:hypothetical protein